MKLRRVMAATAFCGMCFFDAGVYAQEEPRVHPFISSKYSVQVGAYLYISANWK